MGQKQVVTSTSSSEKHSCPMHDRFKVARETLRDVFEQTTIRQLAQELSVGTSFINNLGWGYSSEGKEGISDESHVEYACLT